VATLDQVFLVTGLGPVNQPPRVSIAPVSPVTLPAAAALTATVTDDGPATPTLAWSQVSGPAPPRSRPRMR